jgi:P4 family phage/plasmid primase-like protien
MTTAMATIAQAAPVVLRLGGRLVPCYGVDAHDVCRCKARARCPNPGKHPCITDWPAAASNDLAKIAEWARVFPHANAGMATGRGLLALDVDPATGGAESLRDLEREHGLLPQTPRQITGSGGEHYIFRVPIDLDLTNSAGQIGPGLDIRTDGGQVIVEPSRTNKGAYVWDAAAHPADTEIADAPTWLLALIQAPRTARPATTIPATGVPLGKAALMFVANGAPIGSQSTEACKAARNYLGAGYTEEAMAEALWRGLQASPWDPAREPWTWEDARKIARTIAASPAPPLQPLASYTLDMDGIRRNGHTSGGSHDGNGNGAPDAPDGPEHYTDGGNGGFLAKRYGHDFRFVPGRGFFVWTGTRWARDLAEVRVQGLAQRAVRDLYQLAADEPDDGRRKALAAHAKSSDSAKSVRAMVTMARSAPGVLAESDTFDQHDGRFLFNAANGTVDLRTGRLRPHRRGDYLTKIADIIYDPDAECPLFMDFLDRIFSGNAGVIDYVRRAVGYSMTGDTGEKAMFLCHGDTDTGKSTFLEVIAHAMGEYGTVAAPSLLMETRNEQHLTRVAALAGTRYVTTIETDEGKRLNEAQVKHLTGSDRVTANYMHENMFTFVPSHKLWLATNHLPRVSGTGDAIWARLPVIRFTVRIPEADKDRQLGDKLKAEAAGILAWMVRGAMAWATRGLQPPDEVRTATKDYRAQEDTLADFIAEQCVIREDLIVTVSDLYARYVSWAQAAGEKPQSKRAFGLKMDERGYPDGRFNGHRMRKGIGLRDFSAGGALPTLTPRYGGDA